MIKYSVNKLFNANVRDLIQQGILPDYRLWILRDDAWKGSGLRTKAVCISKACNATEMYRGREQFIIHHLVIFAATLADARYLELFLKSHIHGMKIICIKGGDDIAPAITLFSEATRAIIINCRVLGEGVDIPIANAVAFTYPKHAQGEITQMIFRSGRWFRNKPLFHVILPVVDNEDLTGFENVLISLASCDYGIKDEILLRFSQSLHRTTTTLTVHGYQQDAETKAPETIIIDECAGADVKKIKECFSNIRNRLILTKEKNSQWIQKLCVTRNIDTSADYKTFRETTCPELLEDPRQRNQSWFDFLHPNDIKKTADLEDFVHTVLLPNGLLSAEIYESWRTRQADDYKNRWPSIGHISDGCFGIEFSNYNTLLYHSKTTTRRR